MIKRILIANRGEIAVRIIKTAHKLGIETVAIYTQQEDHALHIQKANFKALLRGNDLQSSYLDIEQIVAIAKQYGADAIHPGYGFLSENSTFAQHCIDNNIIFIGPSPEAIQLMGNKNRANTIAAQNKVPLLKKISGTIDEMISQAGELKLPLVIKAAMGGGGKGMRIVRNLDDLPSEIKRAGEESLRYFGSNEVYIEQYIENPRHIEVQILADEHGNALHLYERECSIQRRHQKIIEEAPAPNLSEELKSKLYADAIKLAKSISYKNAGTIEFLLANNREHYFLEMNTRIQVEHPVTEVITGIDIVEQQIKIAEGKALPFNQNQLAVCGHAIEARIYAENPEDNFKPSFGRILTTHIPHHNNIRIDGGAQATENLNPNFDPLLKKVIAKGNTRLESIAILQKFLNEYALFGVTTNREYLINIINDEDYINANISTAFCKLKTALLSNNKKLSTDTKTVLTAAYWALKNRPSSTPSSTWHSLGYWRQYAKAVLNMDSAQVPSTLLDHHKTGLSFKFEDSNPLSVTNIQIEQNELSFIIDDVFAKLNYFISEEGAFYLQYKGEKHLIIDKPERIKRISANGTNTIKSLKAPIPGKIIEILVNEGDQIKKGDTLMILEAMKTENNLLAWKDTTITNINITVNDQVQLDQILVETE